MSCLKKGLFIFTVLLLVNASGLFSQAEQNMQNGGGQPPLRITPDMAVDMAITNNLLLQQAEIGLDITRRRADYYWNQFIPSVTVSGTLARQNWAGTTQAFNIIPIPPYINPYTITLPQWNMLGNINVSLDLSIALVEGIRSLRLDYQAGILSLDRARLQMEQGIRKMYNSILLLEANAALLRDSFANAQRQAAIAEANFQAGMTPRLTMLQAQVQVENLRPTMNDLESTITNLKGTFALMIGLPFDAEMELVTLSMDDMYIPDDLSEFITHSAAMHKPDIMELQANINALNSRRQALFIQTHTPFLRLGWSLSSTFMGNPFGDNWFRYNNWRAGGNLQITIGMSLNGLFGFTREGQQLRDMDANIQIQNIRLAQMIRETELEIFTKINSLQNILTTMEIQRSAVELAELSYRLTEDAFRAGMQDNQAVYNANLALMQAELQLLTQHFNFLNDVIDLEYSLGIPFGTLSSNGQLIQLNGVHNEN